MTSLPETVSARTRRLIVSDHRIECAACRRRARHEADTVDTISGREASHPVCNRHARMYDQQFQRFVAHTKIKVTRLDRDALDNDPWRNTVENQDAVKIEAQASKRGAHFL